MDKAKRLGEQTPTQSVVLPYTKTYGQEAVDLYNLTGNTCQEWQALQLYDILSVNDEGLWSHAKYGYSVPRRNGKTEIMLMRELWGLKNGETIIHTAHRADTSHDMFEKLKRALESDNLQEDEDLEIVGSIKGKGNEHIEVASGGVIDFRTRTSCGGLGLGADLLVIDEAQEYEDEQESALKYIITSSKNPQTLMCGTPPTAVSSGTVFTKYREATLQGSNEDSGWAEWSVEHMSDVHDKDLWYQANPSLGTIFTERSIKNEIGNDDVDFNIQRLGLWIKYNQKSAISENDWGRIAVDQLPSLRGKLYVGIKYGRDGTNVAMSIAVKTYTDDIFIQVIDCRPTRNGNRWITDFLKKSWINGIVIDGQNGQEILKTEIKEKKIKPKPVLPTVKEVITAFSMFEQALFDETLKHASQPSLDQVATNCEKRAIGSSGGWGYKSLMPEMDIVLLESAVLAYWACATSKEKKKQKILY